MQLTNADRLRLERARHERFRSLFPLSQAILHLDLEETLHIRVETLAEIGQLNPVKNALLAQAWLTFRAGGVALWMGNHCRWIAGFLGNSAAIDVDILESLSAMSAMHDEDSTMITLEKAEAPTAVAPAPIAPTNSTAMPGCTIAMIAADCEASVEAVRDWLLSQSAVIIPFNGEEVVTGEAAILAVSHFTPLLIQRRLADRGLSLQISPQATPQNNSKPARRASALKLPTGYAKTLTKSPKTSLERLLPSDAEARLTYLEAIATETEQGRAWLDRVTKAFTAKYNTEMEKGRIAFLSAARKMFSELRSSNETLNRID